MIGIVIAAALSLAVSSVCFGLWQDSIAAGVFLWTLVTPLSFFLGAVLDLLVQTRKSARTVETEHAHGRS